MSKNNSRIFVVISTSVLLIVAFALITHADSLSIWSDETWSVFHSSKTVEQILREPDVTWPFGYYLLLHGWITVTGTNNDYVLHVFGVFTGILAAAFLIRTGRYLPFPAAGLLAALAFGTSSYVLYFSQELQGYGLMLLTEGAFLCLY